MRSVDFPGAVCNTPLEVTKGMLERGTYEKHVGENATEHTSLDDADLIRLERNDGNLSLLDGRLQRRTAGDKGKETPRSASHSVLPRIPEIHVNAIHALRFA